MREFYFVTDLHGRKERYEKLLQRIQSDPPSALFLGGDILPSPFLHQDEAGRPSPKSGVGFLIDRFTELRRSLGPDYPQVFLILGNDDAKVEESAILTAAESGIWHYAHNRQIPFGEYTIYGYSYVPPTPFWWKDWERYDVSRYVDPGCISPEEGQYSVPVADYKKKFLTIKDDLHILTHDQDLDKTIFLFHSPPYKTKLDRAALDGKMIDHAPLDVHVGSVAILEMIEKQQPSITLHGHVHESARLTGSWQDRIGKTHLFSAAHDGPELALVRFDPDQPENAVRELI